MPAGQPVTLLLRDASLSQTQLRNPVGCILKFTLAPLCSVPPYFCSLLLLYLYSETYCVIVLTRVLTNVIMGEKVLVTTDSEVTLYHGRIITYIVFLCPKLSKPSLILLSDINQVHKDDSSHKKSESSKHVLQWKENVFHKQSHLYKHSLIFISFVLKDQRAQNKFPLTVSNIQPS